MLCEKCGNRVVDGAKFCVKCGARLPDNELVNIISDIKGNVDEYKGKAFESDFVMSVAEMSALGVAFAPMLAPFNDLPNVMADGGEGIYKVVFPNGMSGASLAKLSDGSGYISSLVSPGKGVTGQARLIPMGGFVNNLADNFVDRVAKSMMFSPVMIVAAAALVNIERRLSDIQETQQKIISFLEQRNEADLKGNLNTLQDIMAKYKYHYDNEKFKTNKHILVQEIRRESERNIIFYRERIDKLGNGKSLIHLNNDVDKRFNEIQSNFTCYKLAVYLFAFSTFVEIMLLENFAEEYLNSICEQIKEYVRQYNDFFEECSKKLESFADSAVESFAIGGAAKLIGLAGKGIEKMPIISRSQLDETMIETGARLDKYKNQKSETTMKIFKDNKDIDVGLFLNNIERVNALYNKPTEIIYSPDEVRIVAV